MPVVERSAKPAFEIVLNAQYYFPGDVITGSVKRRAGNVSIVSPHASVQLKFFGRAVVQVDSDRTVRRPNRYNETVTSTIGLIDEQYTLFDGPLHIPVSPGQ